MRVLLFAAVMVLTTCLYAQTKKIAFESHSGSKDHYAISLKDALFASEESDFGLPSVVQSYRLDTVIYLSQHKVVVITEVYSRPYGQPVDSNRYSSHLVDTTVDNALFNRRHSLDSIRGVIRKSNYYLNAKDVDKVVFIGYDNQKKSDREAVPVVIPSSRPGDQQPTGLTADPVYTRTPDLQWIWMLACILGLSMIGGWLSWKLYQPKFQ